MALVLNPHTGHVSPQFHVKFDDFFETVQDKSTDMDAPEPDWKYLSGFAVRKGRPEPAGRGTTHAPEPDWKYLSGFAVKKGRPEPVGRGTTNDLIAPR